MRPRSELIQIIDGIASVLAVNILLGIFLLFLFRYITVIFPGLGTIINKCISPDLEPGRVSLATGFLTISLVYGFLAFGQFIYVIPGIFCLKKKQKWGLMKGFILGSAIAALLTGPCFTQVIWCNR